MSENKIKKALECCAKAQSCIGEECPYFEPDNDCAQLMAIDVLNLLHEKDTEISRLKKSNRNWRRKVQRLRREVDNYDVFYFCSYSGCEAASFDCWKTCPNSVYNKTRTEAYTEFAEDLWNNIKWCRNQDLDMEWEINHLLKVKVGEDK